MINSQSMKIEAIRAVKADGRLIADVASEFGVSQRKLYLWLNGSSRKTNRKPTVRKKVVNDPLALDLKLRSLQLEIELLKTKLSQYQITESFVNGRIVLRLNPHQSTGFPIER